MDDSERMKTITRYYGMLQGLKAIPFGLMLFVLATQDLGWTWLGEQGNCMTTLPLLLFVMVMLFAIDQYYVNLFGKVRPINRRSQMQETTLFLSLFALTIVIENWLAPPVSLMGIAVAVAFFLTGHRSQRYYYIPLGAVIVIASFLPLILGVPLSDRIFGSLGFVLKVIIGLAIMIAGIIDHLMIKRALKTA